MTCKEVEQLLTEDISLGNDARVEDHIGRCGVCRKLLRELDSMSELSRLLREMDQAPADFSSRVYARLARPSLWQLQWKPALVLGLVILGLVGFLWIQEEQPAPEAMLVSEETPREELFARVKDGDLEFIDGDWVEGTYVDVILNSPTDAEYILRLPSRIKVRTNDLNHDIYLNNASY
ncbi:MAG: hypothetical protein IIB03_10535 [Acidobacteria bacterium]|nr:hypothetical protein [Acidobacteriota bacterium]